MDWYYANRGKQIGPVNDADFEKLVMEGIIRKDTLVWHEGMKDWAAYGTATGSGTGSVAAPAPVQVASAPSPMSPAPPMAAPMAQVPCAECGRQVPSQEAIRHGQLWICADCKPVFLQKIREGASLSASMEYAGFWIRFAARIIDGIIQGIVSWIIVIPMSLAMGSAGQENLGVMIALTLITWVVQLGIMLGYETWFLGKYAATPGKMALGLKVVRSDGSPITYGRACGRFFAVMVSYFTLYIGFIIAGFDEEKRALHDRIADTRVVKK